MFIAYEHLTFFFLPNPSIPHTSPSSLLNTRCVRLAYYSPTIGTIQSVLHHSEKRTHTLTRTTPVSTLPIANPENKISMPNCSFHSHSSYVHTEKIPATRPISAPQEESRLRCVTLCVCSSGKNPDTTYMISCPRFNKGVCRKVG